MMPWQLFCTLLVRNNLVGTSSPATVLHTSHYYCRYVCVLRPPSSMLFRWIEDARVTIMKLRPIFVTRARYLRVVLADSIALLHRYRSPGPKIYILVSTRGMLASQHDLGWNVTFFTSLVEISNCIRLGFCTS